MRRVRWLGIVFTLVQFALYVPPPGIAMPFDTLPTGFLIATIIAVINGARQRMPRPSLLLMAAIPNQAALES